VGPIAVLDAVVKKKISSPCPDRPARSFVAIPTELSRLYIWSRNRKLNDLSMKMTEKHSLEKLII
jgi:hypothetical protein